jgi:alkylation response protein AidB-like acyl-CoA dehydrogenase
MTTSSPDSGILASDLDDFVGVLDRTSERWWPLGDVPARCARADGLQDAALWNALVESGATIVGLADALGGGGAGVFGATAAIASAARALQPGGILATAGLATPVLNALVGTHGERLAQALGARLMAGERATAAVAPRLSMSPDKRVRGDVANVLDATASDIVLLILGRGPGTAIVAIDASSILEVAPVRGLDPTRAYGDLHFDAGPDGVTVLLDGDAAAAAAERAVSQMSLAVAADSIGGAESAVKATVDYARIREQFGRAIGSFQGLRHLIVDTHVCVQEAAAAVRHAARLSDWESHTAKVDVHIAKALATDAYIRAASTCVQVHGGIGFTAAVPPHLHVKRARGNETLFGNARWHRARIGELLKEQVPDEW